LATQKQVARFIDGQPVVLRTRIDPGRRSDRLTEIEGEQVLGDCSQELIIQSVIQQGVDMPPVVQNGVVWRKPDVPLVGEFFTEENLVEIELIDMIEDREIPVETRIPAASNDRLDILQDQIEFETMNSIISALRETWHGEKNKLEVSDKRPVNCGNSRGIGAETVGEISLVEYT
jgi:hypothetical protein